MKTCNCCKAECEDSLFLRRGKTWNKCTPCSDAYRVWYLENKETHLANMDTWRENNPERVKALNKAWQQNNWNTVMVKHSKESDTEKGRPWNEEEYVTAGFLLEKFQEQEGACFYCGCEMQIQDRMADDGLTIERLDNSIAHTRDNCVLACFECNCKKRTHWKEPFLLC